MCTYNSIARDGVNSDDSWVAHIVVLGVSLYNHISTSK